MKVVFMGTPEIAAGVLQSLIDSRHEVAAVVTQPDRPSGRGNGIIFSDVKKVAIANNIPVLQPEKASDEGFVDELRRIAPDIIVVAAYGQILRSNVLELPKYRCINVHASLLPKYRGASPIQWVIINGERQTGVTIMYMEKGLDTGDMILSEAIDLAPDETAGSLHDRLMELAGPVLLRAMDLIESGEAHPVRQDDSQANYVTVLKKEMGDLDFTRTAAELERLIRGLIPWPGAYTHTDGRMLKIWKCEVSDETIAGAEPGTVFTSGKDGLFIMTGEGSLKILELQAEGKKRMSTADYLRGARIPEGTVCRRMNEGD